MSSPNETPSPRRITILSRPDCHLCSVIEKMLRRIAEDPPFPFSIEACNVDDDPDRRARYGERIPVVLCDGMEVSAGPCSEGALRRALIDVEKNARGRGPISRILSRWIG